MALQSCEASFQFESRQSNGEPFRTELAQAAFEGDLDRVRRLVEAGAGLDARSGDGGTPLMYAAAKTGTGHTAVVEFLARVGAGLDAKDHDSGWTALMVASALGNVANADVLVEAGADVNAQDDDGLTALRIASAAAQMTAPFIGGVEAVQTYSAMIQARQTKVADILAQAGADPDLGPRIDAAMLTVKDSYIKWDRARSIGARRHHGLYSE